MSGERRFERVQAYVSTEERQRLAKYCTVTSTTESAVVREALDRHLAGTSDLTLILRRLDRLTRAADRLSRDLELLSQSFGLFVRAWLAHTPRLPKEARRGALAAAEERYRHFLDQVAARFSAGKRFVDDLPQDRIADDDELAGASQGAAPPQAP